MFILPKATLRTKVTNFSYNNEYKTAQYFVKDWILSKLLENLKSPYHNGSSVLIVAAVKLLEGSITLIIRSLLQTLQKPLNNIPNLFDRCEMNLGVETSLITPLLFPCWLYYVTVSATHLAIERGVNVRLILENASSVYLSRGP